MLQWRGAWLFLLLLVGSVLPALSQATSTGRYDQQIQEEVEKALKSKPKFQNVHATTEDGIVTLTGTVKLCEALY